VRLAAVVVGVNLDPVRAVAGLVAHRRDHLGHAGHRNAALRNRHVGAEAHRTRTVAILGDRRARCDEQMRTGNHAVIDRLLHLHVGVTRALGAEVTQCGEARHQRVAHVVDRFDGAIRQRLLQHLIIPQRLVIRMQEDVRVRVDQPRQQRGAGQVDGLRIRRQLDRIARPDRGDLVAFHQHRPARVRRFAARVEHAVGGEQVYARRRLRAEHWRRRRRTGQRRDDRCRQRNQDFPHRHGPLRAQAKRRGYTGGGTCADPGTGQYSGRGCPSNSLQPQGGKVMIKAILAVVVGVLLAAPACAGGAHASSKSVKHGEFLVNYGGCHDCHTPGWAEGGGQAPKDMLLTGGGTNFQGPWGTTYAPNLRLLVQTLTTKQWIAKLRSLKSRPAMPYWTFRYLSDKDLTDMYAYIHSLGPAGKPAHDWVPPGQNAPAPYLKLVLPAPPAVVTGGH